MITKAAIESAYSFFHQKQRVYAHSGIESQKDDIEYAIASYVEKMNPELYGRISCGKAGFLTSHGDFATDMSNAVERLESIMQSAGK